MTLVPRMRPLHPHTAQALALPLSVVVAGSDGRTDRHLAPRSAVCVCGVVTAGGGRGRGGAVT